MFSFTLFILFSLSILSGTGFRSVNGFPVAIANCTRISASVTTDIRCCPNGAYRIESGEIVSFVASTESACGNAIPTASVDFIDHERSVAWTVLALVLSLTAVVLALVAWIIFLSEFRKVKLIRQATRAHLSSDSNYAEPEYYEPVISAQESSVVVCEFAL
jgi:hypothetical protein